MNKNTLPTFGGALFHRAKYCQVKHLAWYIDMMSCLCHSRWNNSKSLPLFSPKCPKLFQKNGVFGELEAAHLNAQRERPQDRIKTKNELLCQDVQIVSRHVQLTGAIYEEHLRGRTPTFYPNEWLQQHRKREQLVECST